MACWSRTKREKSGSGQGDEMMPRWVSILQPERGNHGTIADHSLFFYTVLSTLSFLLCSGIRSSELRMICLSIFLSTCSLLYWQLVADRERDLLYQGGTLATLGQQIKMCLYAAMNHRQRARGVPGCALLALSQTVHPILRTVHWPTIPLSLIHRDAGHLGYS